MIYRFNNSELDTKNFRLTVNSKEVAIEPLVFNLLVHLIENRNKIISRDEILAQVWHGRIVSDTSINNYIKTARKALGDDGQKQQLIKTIHSRGYQFISNTEVIDTRTSKPEKNIIHNPTIETPVSRKIIIISVLLTLLVIISIIMSFQKNDQSSENTAVIINPSLIEEQVIVVVPFNNTNPDLEFDYLGFALVNQIIGELAYLNKFTIRPSESVRQYVNQLIAPIDVGKKLKADFILSGNYLIENDLIRLNIELFSLNNNKVLWHETIEVNYSNAFELQDLVASKVATGLNTSLTTNGLNKRYRDIPSSSLAYEYFLRGIAYPFSNNGHKMAVQMLEKSIALDANFAPSYAHLGNHKRLLEQHGRITSQDPYDSEWYYKTAIMLNPNLLEALGNLSGLYTETNRIEDALLLTRKMLTINPNNAASHFSLGYIYRYAGMLEESITEMEAALTISPDNSRFRSIISTYISAGKYQEALSKTYLDKGDYGIGYSGIIAFTQEDYELARQHFNRVLDIDANGIWGLIAQLYISVMDKDIKEGLSVMKRLEQSDIEDAENSFYFSSFYALLGEKDKSLILLAKAVNNGYFNYPHILNNSAFDILRDNDKFNYILNIAKTRHDAFRKKFL